MSIRKIKDAKDLATNELIYFKGHAKATYMSDGNTVENAIKNLEAGGNVDLSGYATNDYVNSKLEDKVNTSSLATVATSGSYNDLSNKPTIPTEVTESTVSGWGFVKSAGTYSKPSTGIPKTDLESAIQTSLDKADTALQEHQDISHLATKDEVADLTNEMIANEEVHAAAYTDLDSRLKDIGSLISGVAVTKEEFQEGIQNITNEIIANEEVHAAALNDLNERINAISENVSGETATKIELQSAVESLTNTILENEEVTAAALNDLNERIENAGGSSNANVQTVDTGDVLDDVTVNYATKAYVDGKVANIDLTNYATIAYVEGLVGDINSTIGDINSALESIING